MKTNWAPTIHVLFAFFQACRGDLFDPGVEVTDAEEDSSEATANTTTGGPDVLIYYSTVKGRFRAYMHTLI